MRGAGAMYTEPHVKCLNNVQMPIFCRIYPGNGGLSIVLAGPNRYFLGQMEQE